MTNLGEELEIFGDTDEFFSPGIPAVPLPDGIGLTVGEGRATLIPLDTLLCAAFGEMGLPELEELEVISLGEGTML